MVGPLELTRRAKTRETHQDVFLSCQALAEAGYPKETHY